MPESYPKWKYHKTKAAVVVDNQDEEDALGAGWKDSSTAFAPKDEEAQREQTQAEKAEGREKYRDSLEPPTAPKNFSDKPEPKPERVTTYQSGGVTRTAVGEVVHTMPELDTAGFPPAGEVKLPDPITDPALTNQPNLPVAPKAAVEAAQKGDAKPAVNKPAPAKK